MGEGRTTAQTAEPRLPGTRTVSWGRMRLWMFYFREGALSEVVRKWLAAPARSPRPVKSRGELRALALAQARCAPARRRSTASANGGGIGAPGRRKSIASEDGP